MKKIGLFLLLLSLLVLPASGRAATEPSVSITPAIIYQGDPVMVTVTSISKPVEILFDKERIPILMYAGLPRGFIAIDINQKAGAHKVHVRFADGKIIDEILTVTAREKLEAPLGIPSTLGGNTPAAQKSLVNNLSKENASLMNLRTGTKAFWTKSFRAPLDNLTVTDSYGYNRKTGEYAIPHKGTDFHAAIGTKVMAMNRGVVRIARTYTVYGKTIVIDHGFGLSTLYMHLSKIKVNEGELVQPGQAIGLSGASGYAEGAHLHISVKINGISIDPMKFLAFFGVI